MRRLLPLALALGVLGCGSAGALELSGYVGGEFRGFAHAPRLPIQRRNTLSFVAEPELYHGWDGDRQSLLFVPFARADSADGERSHVDVRELLYQRVGEDWELRAGIGKVFWGVTESQHLVDVINQTDLVENVDGEDKLGQPMVNVALIRDWGTLDLFVLPTFRERTFPGAAGRLRTVPRTVGERATYESGAGRKHVDFAVRWSHVIGDFDLGLSHFYGTARDPLMRARVDSRGAVVLVPHYDIVHQTGVSVQATKEDWLWKLEAIHRSGQGESFFAFTGGFERSFYGVLDSSADVGALVELLYDDRGDDAPTPFEADLFAGLRFAFNDAASTEVLAGFIRDLEGDATVFSVEASRRLGDRWKLEVEGRAWNGVRATDPLRALSSDDYLQISVQRYF